MIVLNNTIISLDELLKYFSYIIENMKTTFFESDTITYEIAKKHFIIMAKKIRSENLDKWDKSVARRFGELLKMINIQSKFKLKWEKRMIKEKHYISDILYEVKRLTHFNLEEEKEFNLKWDVYSKDPNSNKISVTLKDEIDISNVRHIYHRNNSIFIITNEIIACKGDNGFGQLGVGTNISYKLWVNFTSFNRSISDNLIKICFGYAFTFFLTEIGIYSVGCGDNGRLGTNSTSDINIPQKIDIKNKNNENETIIDIACGSKHSCFLTNKFEVYSCGSRYINGFSDEDILVPVKLNLKNIISISIGCGGYHTCCLTKNGILKVWGHNRAGQLGIENKKLKELYSDIVIDGDIVMNPIEIQFKKSIIKAICGWGHTLILTLDNELYVCGRNSENQLGIKESKDMFELHDGTICTDKFLKIPLSNVTDMTTNHNISYVKANNELWVLGTKDYLNQVNINDININRILLEPRKYDVPNFVLLKKN